MARPGVTHSKNAMTIFVFCNQRFKTLLSIRSGSGNVGMPPLQKGIFQEILQGMKRSTKLLIVFFCISCTTPFSSCGKKGDPSAPVTVVPKKINDLKAHPQERAVVLSWSIPEENTDGSQLLDLKGFKVLRNETDIKTGC